MSPSPPVCPACGSRDTSRTEVLWEAGQLDPESSAAPPVPREAATNAARFYAVGFLGLIAWIILTVYACSFVAARAESVLLMAGVGMVGVIAQLVRLFTGSPKPTADQIAALEEWKAAHARWQRRHTCQRCGETFGPGQAEP